jgi:eukaryotic-like serine/threonine-protein kinase
LDEQ